MTQIPLLDSGHRITGTAEIDGRYRYTLGRRWCPDALGPMAHVLWVMLNPSTADADAPDPTITRCMGFADSWGFAEIRVVNLFALRDKDPRALVVADDPVGPANDSHITREASLAAIKSGCRVVVAWGRCGPLASFRAGRLLMARRVERVAQLLEANELWCLGTNADGSPRHPLYLAGSTTLVPWRAP